MGRPSHKGFQRNTFIAPVHSEGEKLRERTEATMAALSENKKKEITEGLVVELKPHIVNIVERAFRRYCKHHSATKEMEDLEWKRFKKILNGML